MPSLSRALPVGFIASHIGPLAAFRGAVIVSLAPMRRIG